MTWYFEDVQVGTVEDGPEFTADKDDMIRYATENDPYPIHLDEAFAQQSPFGGLIAPFGYTLMLFFRSMHGLEFDRAVQNAFLGALEWRVKFAGPVRPGDRVHDRCTIIDKRLSSKGDRGVVTTRHEIVNQNDDVPVTIEIVSLLAGKSWVG
jgi:acyl dehydratase